MPQSVPFDIPYPARISPDLDRARQHHLEWMRAMGLTTGEKAIRRYARWTLSELAARFYPTAFAEDLELAADAIGWFFPFDDQFDGAEGDRRDAAHAACGELRAMTLRPAGTPTRLPVAVTRSWGNIWTRESLGMSPSWRERAAADWREYFAGYAAEAAVRREARPIPVEEYLHIRRATIGVKPVLGLAERVQHCELPASLAAHPHLDQMRNLVADTVTYANDVCSVEKEEARDDTFNLVLILQRHHLTRRSEAIRHIQGMMADTIHRFEQLRYALPALCRENGLREDEAAVIGRFVRDGMESCIRGNYDWQRESGRYTPADVIPGSRANYLEDLVTPSPESRRRTTS
ncbi:pentalenene synthase [Streptomyces sp. NPDC091387]|uniref:terpene synthase family protein n=1 Tax=Streptomyces sp. NPDC091387 TaxID=3365998 RepID=UPI003805DB97